MRYILAFIALFAAAGSVFAQQSGWRVADSVKARVDDTVITQSQLRSEGEFARLEGEPGILTDVELLRRLVRRRLVVAEATKLRMSVPPEEVRKGVDRLAGFAGGEEKLAAVAGALGMTSADLERRAADMALVERYLGFRRESAYVSESEVRAYVAKNPEIAGSRPIAKVRDEVREFLAAEKYREELDRWIDRQLNLGRVRIIPVAEVSPVIEKLR
ncbi:hypothetical protein EPN96_04645 [bacterium]|nr:MAG: hypothetical protein EPN96_04645 [bacterium]